MVPDARYEQFEVMLQKGDRLIIFSDGVPECMRETGVFFDDENLVNFMRDWKRQRGPNFLDGLLFELD